MRNFLFSFLAFSFVCIFSGCLVGPYYQKEETIPQNAWNYNFKPAFTFEITDTNAVYKPYFVIRHSQAYPYCNLWFWLSMKMPGDSVLKKERINIVLSDPTGKWKGRGMGEIYEQQMEIKLGDSLTINKIGTYQVSFEQNMRVNPLPDVMNVGLRIEKVLPKP